MTVPTWDNAERPDLPAPGLWGWSVVVLRGAVIIACLIVGMIFLTLLRLIERPLFGMSRPFSPYVVQVVCRISLRVLGIQLRRSGKPMTGRGAIVANHTSWLDIFVLNASDRIFFVSKAEVAGWPGIGILARATGTLFINRSRRDAKAHSNMMTERLKAQHRLLFFPEGTSTDGQQVLPFKTTLFAAFFQEDLARSLRIQPVSVTYHAPKGKDHRLFGWWGDMEFGTHLLATLANTGRGQVDVVYHEPISVAEAGHRKILAKKAEDAVRAGHMAHLAAPTS